MKHFELLDAIQVKNTLGEGVLWNERQQTVWWTDILEAKLYSYHLVQRVLTHYNLPERLASFGFTTNDTTLICAFESGFALFDPNTQSIDWLARPEKDLAGNRFNDGRVDRQGRFWAGTMVEQPSADSVGKASLYRLSGRDCQKMLGGITISNSISWSPDSSKFYFADSPSHTIHSYGYDAASGTFGNPEIFAKTTPPVEPDGSTIDAEGFLWNAQWGGSKVVRFAPGGIPVDELILPVSQPTCVAFGGTQMNLLFITTARVGLTAEQIKKEPLAGNLLIYHTPYTGLIESRFNI